MCNLCVFPCTASLLLPPWHFWILLFQGCYIGCFALITVLCECIRNWCSVYTCADCAAVGLMSASLQCGQPNDEKFLIMGGWGLFLILFFSRKAFIFCKWCLINSVQSFHPTSFLLKVTYWKNESPNSSLHPPHPLFTVLVYSSWLFNLKGPHVVPIIGEIVHAIRWHVSEIFMRCSVVSQQVL